MDEPREHHAEAKKPNREGHLWNDSMDRKCPGQVDTQRQRVDSWLPGALGCGEEDRVWLLMGTRFPFGVMKTFRDEVEVMVAQQGECSRCH